MNYYTAVSPFRLVAVSVCRRSGLLLIAVSPLWFVAVLVSPFWRVAVLVCRRFDHRPSGTPRAKEGFGWGNYVTAYLEYLSNKIFPFTENNEYPF